MPCRPVWSLCAMALLDSDRVNIRINDALAAAFGYGSDQLVERRADLFVPPDAQKQMDRDRRRTHLLAFRKRMATARRHRRARACGLLRVRRSELGERRRILDCVRDPEGLRPRECRRRSRKTLRGDMMGLLRFSPPARSPDPLASMPASPRDDGAYLTDGQRLFRVVWPLCSLERRELAILEDCKTLCLTDGVLGE